MTSPITTPAPANPRSSRCRPSWPACSGAYRVSTLWNRAGSSPRWSGSAGRAQELRDFIAFCRQGGFAVCLGGGIRHSLRKHGRATEEVAAALLDHKNLDREAAAAIIRPFLDT
jgi:hypothetical protein